MAKHGEFFWGLVQSKRRHSFAIVSPFFLFSGPCRGKARRGRDVDTLCHGVDRLVPDVDESCHHEARPFHEVAMPCHDVERLHGGLDWPFQSVPRSLERVEKSGQSSTSRMPSDVTAPLLRAGNFAIVDGRGKVALGPEARRRACSSGRCGERL
jgi:hypothetical protein